MAISTLVSDQDHWVRRYARQHSIHLLVLVVFAIYPGLYHFMNGAESTTAMIWLLPNMETMQLVMTAGLFAASFDFISGYTGYLSFGHSLFFGTGAFFVLGTRTGSFRGMPVLDAIPPDLHFMYLMVLAAILAVILAIIVGAVSFRLTGVYFAMITLGVAELGRYIVRSYVGRESTLGATGDPAEAIYQIGLPIDGFSLPLKSFGGNMVAIGDIPVVAQILQVLDAIPVLGAYIVPDAQIVGPTVNFYLLGIVALVSYFIMQRIIHSPFGRVMIAIRDNEERAEAIGYNTFWYKMGAFSISAFFAAIAGALEGARTNGASADAAFGVLDRAGEALLATIIGGIGTLAGPFYGFLFDRNLREIFGGVGGDNGIVAFLEANMQWLLDISVGPIHVENILTVWMQGRAELYIGIVFVVFILFVPGGLLGSIRNRTGGKMSHAFPEWVGRRWSGLKSLVNR